MLRRLKKAGLRTAKAFGILRGVASSRWRQGRLLILAYHGVSQDDEHQWDPSLYMPPDQLGQRLQLLKTAGCTVLPLADAIQALYARRLPERAVALTFDDGSYDFYKEAYPIIRAFGFPVTLYLTTFYAEYNRPVFDVACSYLLWKGRRTTLDLRRIAGQDMKVDLSDGTRRAWALEAIKQFARQHRFSAEEKNALMGQLANEVQVDFDRLVALRMLHLLTGDEVRRLASDGVDVQLHTHRHRTPRDRGLFRREIEDNQKRIEAWTGRIPVHFCYPSGVYEPEYRVWLAEMGILSATTCQPGLAAGHSHRFILPRLVDSTPLSNIEFESWLSGVASVFSRRHSGTLGGDDPVR